MEIQKANSELSINQGLVLTFQQPSPGVKGIHPWYTEEARVFETRENISRETGEPLVKQGAGVPCMVPIG